MAKNHPKKPMNRNLSIPHRFRMDPGTTEKLKAIASQTNVAESEIIRTAVTQKLDEWERSG